MLLLLFFAWEMDFSGRPYYVIIEPNQPNLQNLTKRHNAYAIHDMGTPRYDQHLNNKKRDSKVFETWIILGSLFGAVDFSCK